MGQRIIIRCFSRGHLGWGPIDHLLSLMQRLLGAEVQESEMVPLSKLRRVQRTICRPARSGEDVIIYLVHYPYQIANVVADPTFDTHAARRVIWIVDSFLSEQIPRLLMSNFDLVVYMQSYESEIYEWASNGRAVFIPWGTDALDLGSAACDRDIDILRVGRQPPEWEDDTCTAAACARHGLTFHGRPPYEIGYRDLMQYYARARFVIAFSNVVAPRNYTHKSKEYFTGRWTDSTASGAVVAGIPPRKDTGVALRLGKAALIEFETLSLDENLLRLQQAAARWTPETARLNHLNALQCLDWRWSLKRFADRLDLSCPNLDLDLERLRDRIMKLNGEVV